MPRRPWKCYRPQTLEVVVWRKLVYRRDDWRCQWPSCGLGVRTFPFRRIEAHHIHAWHCRPDLRSRVNNGITLCTGHHEMVTGCEERYVVFFQRVLRRAKKTWTNGQEVAAKKAMRLHCLRIARTVGHKPRRRRSRTARRKRSA